MVFRLLAQLASAYYESATPKDLPCRSLQGPEAKQSTVSSGHREKVGSPEHQSFELLDVHPDSHPYLDLWSISRLDRGLWRPRLDACVDCHCSPGLCTLRSRIG